MDTSGDGALHDDHYLAISGGTAILRRDVLALVKDCLTPAIAAFHDQVLKIERIQRIAKVAKAELALEKASKEACILAKETLASRPVLCGLIQETAVGQAEETCREILERERESVLAPSHKDQALSNHKRKLRSLEAKVANAEKS